MGPVYVARTNKTSKGEKASGFSRNRRKAGLLLFENPYILHCLNCDLGKTIEIEGKRRSTAEELEVEVRDSGKIVSTSDSKRQTFLRVNGNNCSSFIDH